MQAAVLMPGVAGGAFPLVEQIAEDNEPALLSPAKYIDVMHLDVGTFAKNAGVHRNTVTRAPGAASVQKHLQDNIRVMAACYYASGQDMARAIRWYRHEPLAPFDYKTAETLVAEGRADDVIRLIESYEAGPAG